MDGLSETSIVGAPYNSVQVGTAVSFAITIFVATASLFLRYVQVIKITKRIEPDLIILTVSYGLACFYFATLVRLMRVGWGRHTNELSMSDLQEFNMILLPNTLTYLITPAVTKIAMLFVLYQINPARSYRYTVIGIGVSIFAYTLALTTITGGPCNPFKAGTTKCLENVALSQSVLNIASDFAVILTPIPTIHGLELSLRQRISIGAILAVGSGVVICSIARLPYVLSLESTRDITYQEGILGIWSLVEINLGVFCGCAMRLKKLIVTYLPALGLSSSFKRSKRSSPFSSSLKTSGHRPGETKGTPHGTYQLHSIQKRSNDPFSSNEGASTESILA
ncbi:hypothetical protein VTK26DRAFT_1569 [Humicola hyalothermophila]